MPIKPKNFFVDRKCNRICMDKYMKIEKIYIIPEEKLYGKTNITISENSQWEEFRVDEEPYNDTYHNMKIEDCTVLRK